MNKLREYLGQHAFQNVQTAKFYMESLLGWKKKLYSAPTYMFYTLPKNYFHKYIIFTDSAGIPLWKVMWKRHWRQVSTVELLRSYKKVKLNMTVGDKECYISD